MIGNTEQETIDLYLEEYENLNNDLERAVGYNMTEDTIVLIRDRLSTVQLILSQEHGVRVGRLKYA
jgi:hypothetical protein